MKYSFQGTFTLLHLLILLEVMSTFYQGCGLGLEPSRQKLSMSRSREADVLVSAIYVSCPRPSFQQIVKAT